MSFIIRSCCESSCRSSIISSAYWKHVLQPMKGWCIIPSCCNLSIHVARKSIAILKRYGDIVFPYLTRLLSVMSLPATELMMTLNVPRNTKYFIHIHHVWEKLFALRTSRRKLQDRVSKALCIFDLKSMSYCLLANVISMACSAYWNLWNMCLPFMNYVCIGWMIYYSSGSSLFVSIFENSFWITFTMLISL
jgi:hypothetical protein